MSGTPLTHGSGRRLVLACAAAALAACAQSTISTLTPAGTGAPRPPTLGKYDRAYTENTAFVDRPNALLAHWVARTWPDGAKGATALDVAMGQGRNTVFLAEQGFAASGFDQNRVGVESALRAARERGLTIDATVANARTFDYGTERWDLVVIMYYQPPWENMDAIKESIRPRGLFILERMDWDTATTDPDTGEQVPQGLRWKFADWEFLHYEHAIADSDWHWGGERTRHLMRFVARKPDKP